MPVSITIPNKQGVVKDSNPLPVKLIDANGNEVGVDESSNALTTILLPHHKIHEGNHYFVASFNTVDDGDNLDFCVTTPNNLNEFHMVFDVQSTSQLEIYLYEDADFDNDGTTITPINSNRNSSNSSTLIIKLNNTINDTGTLLSKQSWGTAINPIKVTGGGFGRETEIILKSNTKYLFRFISRSNGNLVNYRSTWYEIIKT